MTPPELYADRRMWRRVYGHRPVVLPWQVRPYRREVVSPGVILYTADRAANTLIVGFCGRSIRLFLPVSLFLQALDHNRFDLLIASDARQLHFDRGIEGYAQSLPDLAMRLAEFAAGRGYDRVITYGISMGGLVALRVGELMRADRAIAAGGRFAWNIGRLQGGKANVQSFDLLCECRQPAKTEGYAIYSKDNPSDAASAGRLAAICPQYTIIPMPWAAHNFPYGIHKARRLDQYHRQIFDLGRKPDAAVLASLFVRRPRLDPRRTFYFMRPD